MIRYLLIFVTLFGFYQQPVAASEVTLLQV